MRDVTVIDDGFLGPSLDDVEGSPHLVVLDFSATWCGPCKRYDPVFSRAARDLAERHQDAALAFLHVDVDQNQALAGRLKVKSVPMTVIVAKEKALLWGERWSEKARFSGVIPYPRLVEAVEEQLQLLH